MTNNATTAGATIASVTKLLEDLEDARRKRLHQQAAKAVHRLVQEKAELEEELERLRRVLRNNGLGWTL